MELLLATVIAATLLWSLKAGRVHSGWRMVHRADQPIYFWALVLGLTVFALVMLAIFATGL
jgi:hypothetical protein